MLGLKTNLDREGLGCHRAPTSLWFFSRRGFLDLRTGEGPVSLL